MKRNFPKDLTSKAILEFYGRNIDKLLLKYKSERLCSCLILYFQRFWCSFRIIKVETLRENNDVKRWGKIMMSYNFVHINIEHFMHHGHFKLSVPKAFCQTSPNSNLEEFLSNWSSKFYAIFTRLGHRASGIWHRL